MNLALRSLIHLIRAVNRLTLWPSLQLLSRQLLAQRLSGRWLHRRKRPLKKEEVAFGDFDTFAERLPPFLNGWLVFVASFAEVSTQQIIAPSVPQRLDIGRVLSLEKKGWPRYALAASPHVPTMCPPRVCLRSVLCCWLWPRPQSLSPTCPPLVPQTVYCGVLTRKKVGRHMCWVCPWSLSVMWPPCVCLESALATPPNVCASVRRCPPCARVCQRRSTV